MISRMSIVATLGVTAFGIATLVAAPAASAPLGSAPTRPDPAVVAPSTQANARTAMHGEAFAYASYMAYAYEAARTGERQVSRLFTRIAGMELDMHLADLAVLADVVGTDAANLQDAVDGEVHEATTMYPAFAAQATLDGCTAAADLFTELAADEAVHAAAFTTALRALDDPTVDVPAPPAPDLVEITAGPPACTGQTVDNLVDAMHGEAFAYAVYNLYAEHARATGQAELGALFAGTAEVELREHFAELATLAGLVSDNAANLARAVAGELYEAESMYPDFSRQAAAAGDMGAARMFHRIGRQEFGHARAFTAAANRLG